MNFSGVSNSPYLRPSGAGFQADLDRAAVKIEG
jgi:hypothetical protein